MGTLTFITADGSTASVTQFAGSHGFGLAPVQLFEHDYPAVGSVISGSRLQSRKLEIPFVLSNNAGALAEFRSWCRKFLTLDAPLTIRDDTSGREAVAWYSGGAELDYQLLNRIEFVASFVCPSPYFQSSTQNILKLSLENKAFFPWFPMVFSTTSAAKTLPVQVQGDAPCWPIFKVYGPASNIVITHIETNKTLAFPSVAAGSVAILDSRPGVRMLTIGGLSSYAQLTAKNWFPLTLGTQNVSMQATGLTGDSYVQCCWRENWLTL